MISREIGRTAVVNLFVLLFIPLLASFTSARGAEAQDILGVLRSGDGARAREMLDADPSLATYVGGESETPLHYAAHLGDLELVRKLVELGADIDARNRFNQNPLLYAAYEGRVDVCRYLLEKGAAFDFQDNRGNTPILFAARQNHLEVVRMLIEKGAAVDLKGNAGATPLFHAAARGNLEILKMLRIEGAAIGTADDNGLVPVLAALNGGYGEVVAYLVEKGAIEGFTAGQFNDLMHGAAAAGLDDLAELAVERGADTRSRTENGRTLLHSAVAGGSRALAKKAMEVGIDVDEADNTGRTALHLASRGDAGLTEFLLKEGADPNARTGDGTTPYIIAEDGCHDEIMALLVKGGAKKSAPEPLPLKGRNGKGPVEVRYIANEGFIITGGGKKVMFDAFVHNNPWNYIDTGDRVFSMMCGRKRPFDGVDVSIVSHYHADHFDAGKAFEFMRVVDDVVFVANQLSIDGLVEAAGDEYAGISGRVVNMTPEWGTKVSRNIGGIEAAFFGCNHAGADGDPFLTLESIVEIDGIRFLHLADLIPEPSESYIRSAVEGERIDVAFLDRFFMEDSIGALLIEEVIKPQYIIVMHLRSGEVDPAHDALIGRYPNLIVFHDRLERRYFR